MCFWLDSNFLNDFLKKNCLKYIKLVFLFDFVMVYICGHNSYDTSPYRELKSNGHNCYDRVVITVMTSIPIVNYRSGHNRYDRVVITVMTATLYSEQE